MPLYEQTIKNLKNGVSQQPDILRFPEQGEEQINAWSSESEGLQKRPPSLFVKRLADKGGLGANPYVHLINRDEQEKYYVVFTGTSIRVFGLDGTEYSVSGNMEYVKHSQPREAFRVVTVADYTFVVNRAAVVAKGSTTAYRGYNTENRALINVRGGQYGRTLTVTLNGKTAATLTLPNGSNGDDVKQTDAQHIAEELAKQIRTNMAGWTANVGSGYVEVIAPAGQTITQFDTKDGYANQLISPIRFQVQTFSKLPLAAPDGYIVQIVGDTSSSADAYYIRYDAKEKVWKESVGPNVLTDFNASTMPHALVRQANGSFSFQTLDWAKRSAGDDDTNPYPSFTGAKINDVFFYRNRLGFLSGENIVMSRTGKYFNFWPASVATLVDDDPIDVAISHNRISILKYAVPFAEQLLLWSDQAQFVLSSSGVMTSKSIQLDLTTDFDLSDNARPFNVGRSVYFISPRGSFTSVKRYYAVQDVSDVKDAEDITGHVLSYIPNGVFSLQGSGTENFLTVLTDNAKNRVYIYKYLYIDYTLMQASWSYWEFPSDYRLLAASCIGSTIYLMAESTTGIIMERVDFIKGTTDFPQEPYRLHMDIKKVYQTPANSYDDNYFKTTLTLQNIYGFVPKFGDFYVVTTNGDFHRIKQPNGGWTGTGSFSIAGNIANQTVIVGRLYEMRYVFSKFLIKQAQQDGGVETVDSGRLQLRRAWINYQDTGALLLTVNNGVRDFQYTLNGYTLGSVEFHVGDVNVGDGQFRIPVTGNAKNQTVTLSSDWPTPVSVIGCGWQGSYVRASRPI